MTCDILMYSYLCTRLIIKVRIRQLGTLQSGLLGIQKMRHLLYMSQQIQKAQSLEYSQIQLRTQIAPQRNDLGRYAKCSYLSLQWTCSLTQLLRTAVTVKLEDWYRVYCGQQHGVYKNNTVYYIKHLYKKIINLVLLMKKYCMCTL